MGKHGGGCSKEGDGLRGEGESSVLFVFCREQLENRVLETALVSLCSTRENHEGGDMMSWFAVMYVYFCV